MDIQQIQTGCSNTPPEIERGSIVSENRGPSGRFVDGSEVTYACGLGTSAFPEATIVCDPWNNWNLKNLPQCVPGESLYHKLFGLLNLPADFSVVSYD